MPSLLPGMGLQPLGQGCPEGWVPLGSQLTQLAFGPFPIALSVIKCDIFQWK